MKRDWDENAVRTRRYMKEAADSSAPCDFAGETLVLQPHLA